MDILIRDLPGLTCRPIMLRATRSARVGERLNLRALGAININISDTSDFLRAEFIIDQLKLPHQWPEPITQLRPRRFTKLSLGSL